MLLHPLGMSEKRAATGSANIVIFTDPVAASCITRDEFPFPQAKQCSPELDSPSFQRIPLSVQFKCPESGGKPIATVR